MLELVRYNLQPAKDEERCFKYNSLKNAEILNKNIWFRSVVNKYFEKEL